jgi:hypothetical protein
MAERQDPPAALAPYVDAAHRYVERALGVTLDGSEESLAYIDHYIEGTARKEVADARAGTEVLALLAPALGAYLGQVAIARLGGKWVIEGADPAGWRVELEPAPLSFFPVGMAAEALLHAPADNYDASFSTRDDLMGPLMEALESAPPVDENYYYSLTGRLETLEHAADLLVEIERKRRERLS